MSIGKISAYQQDSYDTRVDDEDIVRCEWTQELFVNSALTTPINRFEKKYKELDAFEKGGLTFNKTGLNGMFNMSDIAITSLQDFFKK